MSKRHPARRTRAAARPVRETAPVRRPVASAASCTAIPRFGETITVAVVDVPGCEEDFNFAVADATFCSSGFRMFMNNALREMDEMFHRGVAERRRARHDRDAMTARRSQRNQESVKASVRTLTESSAPDVVRAMVARALHASDDTAETGLIPVVVG